MRTSPISGYVLAGGRSSRMGRDKALLSLGGRQLVEHTVAKLRRICTEVSILSGNSDLAAYAPLVPDIHPGCGPLGGIEAALTHSPHDWILILPVDVPFLPSDLLGSWVTSITGREQAVRVAMFAVDGRPQPAVCLLHKHIAPSIAAAVALGEFKLLPVLEASAEVLALQMGEPVDHVLRVQPVSSHPDRPSKHLWFTNLNTPEDLARAETHLDALEPDLP